MGKINITKRNGNEALNLISAFKADGNAYLVFDSEKTGSMGLPIIYVSKYTTKLEKITDNDEWQKVKGYLKGIINGANFEYIKVDNNLSADDAYYMPLTLPQASFDLIKNRYVVEDSSNTTANLNLTPPTNNFGNMQNSFQLNNQNAPQPGIAMNQTPAEASTPNITPELNNSVSVAELVNNVAQNYPQPPTNQEVPNTPSDPLIPNIEANSNEKINTTFVANNVVSEAPKPGENSMNIIDNNFDNDKETFLKACENMFDALISKYQKQLADVEVRQRQLAAKEAAINNQIPNLQGMPAKQVTNIAQDNAARIMNIENMIPNISSNNNQTSGI